MKVRILLALGVALGCSASDTAADRPADTTKAPPSGGATTPPKPQPQPPAPAPSGDGNWAVTPFGIGPVRAGMTVAEAGTALGAPLTVTGDAKECAYARAAKAPEGVSFMVVDNHIARVDVIRTKSVATVEGARIGSSEARIDSLYQGRVMVQPHKYTDGHYLVVGSGAGSDTTNRIVFETDGKVVTLFRSGRMPEVGWVEGCS
jgi:hypothetical protein